MVSQNTGGNMVTFNKLQSTLEQHRLELYGSTYMQIFFSKVFTTTTWKWNRGYWRNSVYRELTISNTQIFDCMDGQHRIPHVVQGSTVWRNNQIFIWRKPKLNSHFTIYLNTLQMDPRFMCNIWNHTSIYK